MHIAVRRMLLSGGPTSIIVAVVCPAKYLPQLVQGAVGYVMEHAVAV